MSVHSKLGASIFERVEACPGAMALCEGIPSIESPAAADGSLCHSLSQKYFEDEITIAELYEQASSQEMVEAVALYTNLLRTESKTAYYFCLERGFHNKEFHEQFFGTCDAVGYWREKKLLRIYDLKYGRGHKVHVEENPQLLYYGLGAVMEYDFEIDAVELVVVQPRMPNRLGEVVHRWKFEYPEPLLDFALRYQIAASRALEVDAPLEVGAWCWFCPANKICPAQASKRHEKAEEAFSPVVGE